MTEYICGFCGTKHTNLSDYAKCVSKCNAAALKKKSEEEANRRKAEQEAEVVRKKAARESRMSKIRQLETDLQKLYAEEYAEYPNSRQTATEDIADAFFSLFPEIFKVAR